MTDHITITKGSALPQAFELFHAVDVSTPEGKQFIEEHSLQKYVTGNHIPAAIVLQQAGLDQKKVGGIQCIDGGAKVACGPDANMDHLIMLTSLLKQQVRDKYSVQMQEAYTLEGF